MSRGLTFWNDETIKLIRESFVAVAVPTWVCRVEGPEGDFLRLAGIDKQWVTSSGYMTCVSASGKMLGRSPSDKVLEAFQQLHESERRPGAVKVRELRPAEATIPAPPAGGLVLRVHARFLARDEKGALRHARTTDFPLMRERPRILESWKLFLQPNTECLWLTAAESQSLVPPKPTSGQRMDVGQQIAQRLARFHLNPKRATTSEGGIVHPKSVKDARLALVVQEVTPQVIRMRLVGSIHWGSHFEEAKATSPNGPLPLGYQTPLHGRLEWDRRTNTWTRFDIIAPGEVWGRWGDANNKSMYVERPGREPFGFALELAPGDSPTDRIPPGGNGRYVSERTGYFGK